MVFGLITEGPTDQVVIRHLLARYFSNAAIDIRTVQPNTDSSDRAEHNGGCNRVLTYCKSPDMLSALEAIDCIIIQMDTDCCEEYGVPKRKEGIELTDEEIVVQTKQIIVDNIGNDLYQRFKEKIVFAISHESIECWLLPLYFTYKNSQSKTLNCCEALNHELAKKELTIDCDSKKPFYYNKICKEIKRKEQIIAISAHNNSFKQFVSQLAALPQ